ncbi:MAG: hypothetical protein H6747_15095 [Deltaproteobacteria bacterium]|nr:hypothetical protein [Deltaproteobacteria bacterium]
MFKVAVSARWWLAILLLAGCRAVAPESSAAPSGTEGARSNPDVATSASADTSGGPGISAFAGLFPTASITCGGACPAGTACVAGACKTIACTPTMPSGTTYLLHFQAFDASAAGCDLDGDGTTDNSNWQTLDGFLTSQGRSLPSDVSNDGLALLLVGASGPGPVTLFPVTGEVLPSGAFAISADSVDVDAPVGPCPFRESWQATLGPSGTISLHADIPSAWALFPFAPNPRWGTVPVHDFGLALTLVSDASGAPSKLSGTFCGAYEQKAAVERTVAFISLLIAGDPLLAGMDDPAIAGQLHVADIDTDGDGKPDAVSFGNAIAATAISTVGFQ